MTPLTHYQGLICPWCNSMQWLPQGLPMRRRVQRCISRFFSTNNWKNIYSTTPDMHPVCDIFTFLDSNVFYVAYNGKSISWIFINFVHWNCSQTVALPLPRHWQVSDIPPAFFPSNTLLCLSLWSYSRGQKEGSQSKEETFCSIFFSFLTFLFLFLFFFPDTNCTHCSQRPACSSHFQSICFSLLSGSTCFLLDRIISCTACSWRLQFDIGDLISLAYKKVFTYPQWYSQIIFSSGTSHPQYQENLQQNSVIYKIATPPGIQVWASDMGTGDFFPPVHIYPGHRKHKWVQSQKTTVGLLLSLPLVQIKPGTSWTLIFFFFFFPSGRLCQQHQSQK